MTLKETYAYSPGSVENYLAWVDGLDEGLRGVVTRQNTALSEVRIEGSEQTMAALKDYLKRLPEACYKELGEWAEKILSESKKEVPWDTTHLLQTGTIEPDRENALVYQIGYNTPYAARQHEDMTFYHPKPGRKAKYLEDPAMRIAPLIAPGITAELDRLLAPGVPSMTGMRASTRAGLGNLGGRWV
jgi:hypothetical protein